VDKAQDWICWVFLVLCRPKGERNVSLLFGGCGDARSAHLIRLRSRLICLDTSKRDSLCLSFVCAGISTPHLPMFGDDSTTTVSSERTCLQEKSRKGEAATY
jgi:hypothetical protein